MKANIQTNGAAKEMLSPESLKKLDRLKLEMQRTIEGLFSGRHKSPIFGSSVEFADHKTYTPGDDIRSIDWKAFARSDKFTLKRFEAETNLSAVIVLDCTGSMGFKNAGERSKLDFAKVIAASLSYILLKQHDTVGFVTLGETAEYYQAKHGLANLAPLLLHLSGLEAAGSTSLEKALELIRARMKRKGYIAVISDFFEETVALLPKLRQIAEKEHSVSVFHTLDESEIKFPYEEITRFEDIEGGGSDLLNARELAEQYRFEINKFIAGLKKAITSSGGEYVTAISNTPVDETLIRYLKQINTKRKR